MTIVTDARSCKTILGTFFDRYKASIITQMARFIRQRHIFIQKFVDLYTTNV